MTGILTLPKQKPWTAPVTAAARPGEEPGRTNHEYEVLLSAFVRLLDRWEDGADGWEVVGELVTLRCSHLIERALLGLDVSFDHALNLVRHHNDFITEQDRQLRERVVAAMDNLVDFAAAGQYAMIRELPEILDGDSYDEYEKVFCRYNLTYARTENEDVLYAGSMARWWIGLSAGTMLTFMTQADERVRPWHASLEGLSYPKSDFPPELIPPIEFGCRCFLVGDGASSIEGSLVMEGYDRQVNPVFRESLATGGRIFSLAHPYFRHSLPPQVSRIVRGIKSKLSIA